MIEIASYLMPKLNFPMLVAGTEEYFSRPALWSSFARFS
jgi:hypothetical protein